VELTDFTRQWLSYSYTTEQYTTVPGKVQWDYVDIDWVPDLGTLGYRNTEQGLGYIRVSPYSGYQWGWRTESLQWGQFSIRSEPEYVGIRYSDLILYVYQQAAYYTDFSNFEVGEVALSPDLALLSLRTDRELFYLVHDNSVVCGYLALDGHLWVDDSTRDLVSPTIPDSEVTYADTPTMLSRLA
jgi:hypothetical protein